MPISAMLTVNVDGTSITSNYPGYISGLVISDSRFVLVGNPTKVPGMQIYNLIPLQ